MNHLPECPKSDTGIKAWLNVPEPYCICDRLRACEQRVLSLNPVALGVRIAQRARGRALDAAREAVAGVGVRKDTSHDMRVQALAAIDALREKQK